MSTVIKVERLSKKYLIGHMRQERYLTFRDALTAGTKRTVNRLMHPFRSSSGLPLIGLPETEEFWALRDISFEVKQGDRIGIIGRNGAGKTTLLRILSRITEPSGGKVFLKGRVASLLEVGTGFHPELTGRENVYLNGSILGMSRSEIGNKFDEIVDFAEIEQFLDTPVKRYSSGMYVRLAFAVAAHLEPEILLVDEVLAVGDAQFQSKCLGKMGDISREGRTVLFVSHNMAAVRQLVSEGFLLDEGQLVFKGDKDECISQYMETITSNLTNSRTFPDRKPDGESPVVIKGITLFNEKDISQETFNLGEPLIIEILLEALRKDVKFQAMVQIQSEFGVNVYHCPSPDAGMPHFKSGDETRIRAIFPKIMLYPGKYNIHVGVYHPGLTSVRMDKVVSAVSFTVDQSAGMDEVRPLGKSDAVVHEVPEWQVVDADD